MIALDITHPSAIGTEYVNALLECGRFHEGGIDLRPDLPFDEWVKVGEALRKVSSLVVRADTAVRLAIGDWLAFGLQAANSPDVSPADRVKYNERYSQYASLSGFKPGYLQNLAYVSRQLPPGVRSAVKPDAVTGEVGFRWPDLSLGHLQAVAALRTEQAVAILDMAQEKGWTRDDVRDEVRYLRSAEVAGPGAGPALPRDERPVPDALRTALARAVTAASPDDMAGVMAFIPDAAWDAGVRAVLGWTAKGGE